MISAGPSGLRLFRNDRGVSDATSPSLLGGLADGAASGAVAADYDNDGRADLFVLRPRAATACCIRRPTARSRT